MRFEFQADVWAEVSGLVDDELENMEMAPNAKTAARKWCKEECVGKRVSEELDKALAEMQYA